MIPNHTITVSRFFKRTGSVYALCALLASTALGQTPAEDGKDVNVTGYGTVDISVQDTDLAVVLQMLSIEAKKNIITSKSVSASVTANLYDVTFHEALKAILEVNGYTYYEEGNFVYVITKEEWETMQKAARRTESRIFELEHLSPIDALEFIQPLLSADGKASARGEVSPGIKPSVEDVGADNYAFTPRLVVNDYPEQLDSISALLSNLDTAPQQVLVEATIIQTTLDEANAFGVDFTVLGSLNFTDLVNPLAAVNSLIGGADATVGVQPADNRAGAATSTVGGTAGGAAGLKVGILTDEIAVFLRVLDEVIDSTVLARPKVMALNRQRAQVLVGARVGYLSTTSTETTTTQSVSFLDTGIQLVFRPFISKDGNIRMELAPSVSEASLRNVTDANGLIVTIPDELTNELTTNVRIKDGQTLVLGGLFKDATQVTRRQVPLLGDIPVVGALFRGQDDSVQRSEIIFLITPSIVHDDALWAAGAEIAGAIDSIRVGARAGLLPFSRDKVTANYNQKAQEAFDTGDNEKALYYINNSLRVNPNQAEIIRLREKVTSTKAKAHERSLMQRVFRKDMGFTVVNGELWPNAAARTYMQPAPATTQPQTQFQPPMSPTSTVNQPTDHIDWPLPTAPDLSSHPNNDAELDWSWLGETLDGAPIGNPAQPDSSTNQNPQPDSPTNPGTNPNGTSAGPTNPTTAPTASSSSSDPQQATASNGQPALLVNPDDVLFIEYPPYTHQPTRTMTGALAANVGADTVTGAVRKPLTPQQRAFYQKCMSNFFVTLGMPQVTADAAFVTDSSNAGTFQFATFDDATGIANVDKSADPRP